jgi:hypothetical protein
VRLGVGEAWLIIGLERILEITKDTRVSAILEEYGDIAEVMEIFGVKRVARYSFRRMLTKALTVERAALVHRVPLDEFLERLRQAVALQEQKTATGEGYQANGG